MESMGAHLFDGESEEGPGALLARLGEHVQIETALEDEQELAVSQLAQLKTKVSRPCKKYFVRSDLSIMYDLC